VDVLVFSGNVGCDPLTDSYLHLFAIFTAAIRAASRERVNYLSKPANFERLTNTGCGKKGSLVKTWWSNKSGLKSPNP
jgi:hypothetical protein